jgi:bacteriocin biosynthesis cyclodehydratase domain-containing protein
MELNKQRKLKMVPLQCIEVDNGVILKRGCLEARISGEDSTEIIRSILLETAKGASVEKILETFSASDHLQIEGLLEGLVARRFLVAEEDDLTQGKINETHLDIFYWNFGTSVFKETRSLMNHAMVILGVNNISRQLALALCRTGINTFTIIDDPFLRNLSFFNSSGELKADQWPSPLPQPQNGTMELEPSPSHCIIATSDFGGRKIFSQWNVFCLKKKMDFFPVLLKNLTGYVGPLVIPGETACFECLLARQDSHVEDIQAYRSMDAQAFEGQKTIGFHPSMASILGDIAAFELIKFYGCGLPKSKIGTLIEVNLLATKITTRKVLRVPRCLGCSSLLTQPSTSVEKNVFAPINELQR